MARDDASDRIPTTLRTLLILEALAKAGEPLSAAEIGRRIGLGKQTVHRLCVTLEDEGFLTRPSDSKRFVPARRSRAVGAGLLFTSRLHIARHQVLEDVARQIGETVNFVVPEDTGMSYLDRVETDWPFRVQLPIGTNVPFHCTASGKMFMASLAPKARTAFVAGLALERHTDRTHVSADTLLADLKESAKRGYALDNEEFFDGMVAIAVPICDANGRFVAALAYHAPTNRISIDLAVARREIILKAALRMEQVLFSD